MRQVSCRAEALKELEMSIGESPKEGFQGSKWLKISLKWQKVRVSYMDKMSNIGSKKALEVLLSGLEGFIEPKVRVEQYSTEADIAAEVLWNVYMKGDIGKVSVDLGCGTGILGLGLLALGAQKVHFVDSDQKVIGIARQNLAKLESECNGVGKAVFRCQDVVDFNEPVELVIQNPPFGTKVRHNDKIFLKKAFEVGKVIYSFHKSSTKSFVEAFSSDYNFKITDVFDFRFPLKATMKHHTKKIQKINVSCFRLEKVNS